MEILKSSRHARITGDFGQAVVLYWLSKHGFECARVNHTGINIIARNPLTEELMGISVESRSWSAGKGQEHLSIPAPTSPRHEQRARHSDAYPTSPW